MQVRLCVFLLANNLIIGSTTDNGNRLQVTGNSNIIGNFSIGTSIAYNKLTIEGLSARMDLNDGGAASRKALIIEPLGYNSNTYARIESYKLWYCKWWNFSFKCCWR